jgi:hypothetical protein
LFFQTKHFFEKKILSLHVISFFTHLNNFYNMKKMKFVLMAAFAAMMFFTACEIEDLDSPTITLVGGDMEVVLNAAGGFVEPGFEANDEQDGDLTANVIVTGAVDVTKIGSYEIMYSVSDKAGNKATVKRIVDVIVNQAFYTGPWSVEEVITGTNPDPNWMYNATVTASTVDPQKLIINNFGGFANFSGNVTFNKFGVITIPNQQLIGATVDGTIVGTGTTSLDGNTLTITYDVTYTAGGSDNCVGTWTKSK